MNWLPIRLYLHKKPWPLFAVVRLLIEHDRWAGTGVPFIKTGRLVRYRKKDIREWLESHTAFQSTTQAQQQTPVRIEEPVMTQRSYFSRRRRQFNPQRLPAPIDYYQLEFPGLMVNNRLGQCALLFP